MEKPIDRLIRSMKFAKANEAWSSAFEDHVLNHVATWSDDLIDAVAFFVARSEVWRPSVARLYEIASEIMAEPPSLGTVRSEVAACASLGARRLEKVPGEETFRYSRATPVTFSHPVVHEVVSEMGGLVQIAAMAADPHPAAAAAFRSEIASVYAFIVAKWRTAIVAELGKPCSEWRSFLFGGDRARVMFASAGDLSFAVAGDRERPEQAQKVGR